MPGDSEFSCLFFVYIDYLGRFLQEKKLCIIQVIQFNLHLQYVTQFWKTRLIAQNVVLSKTTICVNN